MDTIAYERPRYMEQQFVPRKVFMLLVLLVGLVVLGGSIAALVLSRRGFDRLSILYCMIGPCIGAVPCVAGATVRSMTAVYSDRIEVGLYMANYCWKRYQKFWPSVIGVEIETKGQVVGYSVLGVTPNVTLMMFGGMGVRLKLIGDQQLIVGSQTPAKLLQAITEARSDMTKDERLLERHLSVE